MVGGFGNVKKKPYLCIVIMIQFSYGRGTDVSWGVLREPALYYYIKIYLVPSGFFCIFVV
jgi:hypothetical protein